MIDFINNFHFLRPWVLVFLLVPLFLHIKNIKIKGAMSSWENICDKALFDYLSIKDNKTKKASLTKYIYIGLISATLAASGPSWKKVEIPAFEIENPIMFVLSASSDMDITDVKPSRLDRAKFLINDILDNSKQGQFGLVIYSQEPYLISPLSDDADLIKNLLLQVTSDVVPDKGDRLDRAIDFAKNKLMQAGFSGGDIIVLASDVGQRFDEALQKAKQASIDKYNLHIIDTSFDGNEKLNLVAKEGNGVYLMLKQDDIKALTDNIQQTNEEKNRISKNLRSNYLDFGYYLVFIPMLCLLNFFRKGILILLFVLYTQNVYAGFLTNKNQDAVILFNNNKYEEALNLFSDKDWRSVTLFKMEKLEEALKEIENEKTEISLYNKGVILTKLCKYEEAKASFEKVLLINNKNDDARYNLEKINELFLKAKEDPSVLNCDENNQDNQNNNDNNQDDNNNKDEKEQQNQEDKNNENNENNKEQEPQQNQENNEQNKEENKQEEAQNNDDKKSDNNNDNGNNEEQENKKQNDAKDDDNNNENKMNDKEPNSSSNEKADNDQNSDDGDKKTPMDNENGEGEEQNNDKENDEKNDDTNNQMTQQNAQNLGAKKGDKDDEYDEKALIMERKYREIPEDIGGLLREFIKKEHLKDRYGNEDI